MGRLVRRHHLDRRHLRVAVLIADAERVERTRDATAKLGCTVLGVRLGEGAPAGVDRWEDVLPLGRPLPVHLRDHRPAQGCGVHPPGRGPRAAGLRLPVHPTSTGRATPILQIDVRDEVGRSVPVGDRGEIWFKGPNLIRGYWNRPDATAETIVDGWLRTGDIGRVDDEGFVYVEDRAKDMILRGGENVYCAEVEAAVYEHPAVHEAAVFGVPHERLGEEVAAVVVPLAGWR